MILTKRNVIFLILLFTVSILFYSINQYLVEFLTYFSPKNEIKLHFIDKVRHELIILYFIIVILIFVFTFILPYLRKYLLSNPNFYKNIKFNTKILKKVLLVFIVLYIVAAPIFVLYSLDISTDESTYAYTGYHYYQFNKFMIKFDNNSYLIPKDMFLQNVPLILLKPIIPYSIDVMRYITYFYSMVFVMILYFFYRINYGILSSKILLIMLASYSGFIFLSGTSFGENSALLFALTSIYLFSRYYESNKIIGLHISALLLSLSILTKIQIGFFIIPSLMIFSLSYYLKGKDYRHMLRLFYEVILFSILLVSLLWLTNYSFNEIKGIAALFYSISINSVSYAEKWTNILINVERFFNYHMLLFLPIVFYYFYNRKHEKTFVEKYFFIVFILNAVWFITMKGTNFRFMYYAQLGIMLLSIRPIVLYYMQSTIKLKNTIKLLFSVLLLVGIIQNVKMTVNGVNNDYLFFLNGNNPLKTFFKFKHNNDQKEFYEKVNAIVDRNEPVYYVGTEFEVMAFIPNKFYTFDITTYNPELNIRYIIRTSINDQLDINLHANDFLNTKCEKVFEKGLYSLYKIK